ncbi:hypothetical protein, partial [Ruminococcus intestinalis]
IDKEAYSLYENIENFDITMNTLESKKEFKKYLETTNDKYAYSFRYKLIGCFDKNLMEMFYKRYLQSSNAIKREMGDTLVDISFCDNKYSEHDVTETIANLKELQSRLNDSEQSKNDYITAGINKLFCDKIDSKILEIKQYYK